jgi:hypothetical protein
MRLKGGVEVLTVSACLRVRMCARALAQMRVVWVGVRVCMSAWVWMREGEQHIVTAAPTTTESYKQTWGSWPWGVALGGGGSRWWLTAVGPWWGGGGKKGGGWGEEEEDTGTKQIECCAVKLSGFRVVRDERRTPCDVGGCGDSRLRRQILNTHVARSLFRDRGWGLGTQVEGSEHQEGLAFAAFGGLAFAAFVSWPCRGASSVAKFLCGAAVPTGSFPHCSFPLRFHEFAPGLRRSFARRWGGEGGGGIGGRGGDGAGGRLIQ